MPKSTESGDAKSQLLYALNNRCECALKALRELVAIYKGMYVAADGQFEANCEFLPKLHIATGHIQALSAWVMDGEVLHVMAPEIRCAVEFLGHLVQDSLPAGLARAHGGRHSFMLSDRELALFVHPTPYSLTLSRSQGGFDNSGNVRYLASTYITLMQLLAAYGYALGTVAEQVEPSRVDEINQYFTEEFAAGQKLDWEAISRNADH